MRSLKVEFVLSIYTDIHLESKHYYNHLKENKWTVKSQSPVHQHLPTELKVHYEQKQSGLNVNTNATFQSIVKRL